MSNPSPVLDYAKPAKIAGGWPVGTGVAGLFLVFVLQTMFLSCLCDRGVAKMKMGVAVDGIILARFVIAWIRQETGRGWMIYLFIGLSTVVWIPMIVGE